MRPARESLARGGGSSIVRPLHSRSAHFFLPAYVPPAIRLTTGRRAHRIEGQSPLRLGIPWLLGEQNHRGTALVIVPDRTEKRPAVAMSFVRRSGGPYNPLAVYPGRPLAHHWRCPPSMARETRSQAAFAPEFVAATGEQPAWGGDDRAVSDDRNVHGAGFQVRRQRYAGLGELRPVQRRDSRPRAPRPCYHVATTPPRSTPNQHAHRSLRIVGISRGWVGLTRGRFV